MAKEDPSANKLHISKNAKTKFYATLTSRAGKALPATLKAKPTPPPMQVIEIGPWGVKRTGTISAGDARKQMKAK